MDTPGGSDEIMASREQLRLAVAVVDAARFLLAADPGTLEQVVGRNVVRNLRGAIAKLDQWGKSPRDLS